MDEYLGTIRAFAFDYVPKNWLACNGALLPIAQNQALFSLLGTVYGGNGQTTFALPDLRGRIPIHFGQKSGLASYTLGQKGGLNSITLNTSHLPAHRHNLVASSSVANSVPIAGCMLAATTTLQYAPVAAGTLSPMAVDAIGNTLNPQPVNLTQSSLGLNFCICFQGIFPSRN